MIVKKIHFVIDKSINDGSFKNEVLKKYTNHKVKQSNVIVVIGGDGFMLKTLKKYQQYKKPFITLDWKSNLFLIRFVLINFIYDITKKDSNHITLIK